MTSLVLNNLIMQQLLQVEDIARKSFSHGLREIESFIDSYTLNSLAMSQICDVLLTINIDSSSETEIYSSSLIQKLCAASVQFANEPVVMERIFAVIGTILEHPQRIESGSSSIFLCIRRLCEFLSSTPCSMDILPMSMAAGSSLDQAIHAMVVCLPEQHSSAESTAISCTTCIVQHLDRVQHARSMFHLYIAAGNLIALVSGERERAVVATALDKGAVEIACRSCAALPIEMSAQSGIWHFLEQLVSCKYGKKYFLECPLNTVAMACATHARFCSEEQALDNDESTSSIISSVHRVLSNVVIQQPSIASILKNNNTLGRILHTLRSRVSTSDVVWSALTLLWNTMLAANEGNHSFTQWICIEQLGWNTFLDSFVQFRGDLRIQCATCNTLRAALSTGGEAFMRLLSARQIKRVTQLFVSELCGNTDVEEVTKVTICQADHKSKDSLFETMLLCLLVLKPYMEADDFSACLTQLQSASVAPAGGGMPSPLHAVASSPGLKLLLQDLKVVEEAHAEETTSCRIN